MKDDRGLISRGQHFEEFGLLVLMPVGICIKKLSVTINV